MAETGGNQDQRRLIRFATFVAGAIFMIIWGFYKSQSEFNYLSKAVNSDILDISDVSITLVEFKEREQEFNLRLRSIGLPEPAINFKVQLLAFVCSDSLLQKYLSENRIIHLNMTAYDRDIGKNVDMKIGKHRCESDTLQMD